MTRNIRSKSKRGMRKRARRGGNVAGFAGSTAAKPLAVAARRAQNAVHRFRRCFLAFSLNVGSSSFSVHPDLSMTQGYAEFSSLFDEYRITRVDFTFIPQQMTGEAGAAAVTSVPYLYYAEDNDGNGPTTAATFFERGIVPVALDKVSTFSLMTPTVQNEVYASAISTAYSELPSPWLDLNVATVPHYGAYFLLVGALAGWTCEVFATMSIELRGQR